MAPGTINIKSLDSDALKAQLTARGLKGYRAGQVLSWIYQRFATSFDEMTDIAKDIEAVAAFYVEL